MNPSRPQWQFPTVIALLTLFGVFWLPFLLPPPLLNGTSAANHAGFNNKIAAVVAALLSLVALAFQVFGSRSARRTVEPTQQHLSRSVVAIGVAAPLALLAALLWLHCESHLRYMNDLGYFVEQIAKHADYGRRLYDQLEFPYGPLLFSGPIWVRSLLGSSLTAAYCVTLLLEQALGLLMLAYVLNRLPMRGGYKTLLFILCACLAVPVNLGLNYTFLRFMAPTFSLVFMAQRRTPWPTAVCALAAEVLCLATSPEMGLAFLAGSLVYLAYRSLERGGAWWFTLAAPVAAVPAFLLAEGGGYLRMLGLFARGVSNLIVEPVPYILVFLFALIWLVPGFLARVLRERRPEAALLAALYVSALATLPVGFGRADPQHVLFNGIAVYLLSFVAISTLPSLSRLVWASVASAVLLWTAGLTMVYPQCALEYHQAMYSAAHKNPVVGRFVLAVSRLPHASSVRMHYDLQDKIAPTLDDKRLGAILGDARIATPVPIPLSVEEGLKRTGRYTPSFYCFQTAIVDDSSQQRELAELNQSDWLMLPPDREFTYDETPKSTQWMMGFHLHYRSKRPRHDFIQPFVDNLAVNWQPAGYLDGYTIYRRRQGVGSKP